MKKGHCCCLWRLCGAFRISQKVLSDAEATTKYWGSSVGPVAPEEAAGALLLRWPSSAVAGPVLVGEEGREELGGWRVVQPREVGWPREGEEYRSKPLSQACVAPTWICACYIMGAGLSSSPQAQLASPRGQGVNVPMPLEVPLQSQALLDMAQAHCPACSSTV